MANLLTMLKLIALDGKNWLCAGSERGGQTAAVLFTIISSAKRHRLNTWAYLRDILWWLADLNPGKLEQLLPAVRVGKRYGNQPPEGVVLVGGFVVQRVNDAGEPSGGVVEEDGGGG